MGSYGEIVLVHQLKFSWVLHTAVESYDSIKTVNWWGGEGAFLLPWTNERQRERYVLERAATRWQTNDEGVSLYCWIDENSGYLNWCPQTMTAESYEWACMRSEWPLTSHTDVSGLPFSISTIKIESSWQFQTTLTDMQRHNTHKSDKSSRGQGHMQLLALFFNFLV